MNYVGGDYVMGHILRFARTSGHDTLTIDFVSQEASPLELLASPISQIPANYTKNFWQLVQAYGSEKSLVQRATLVLQYDIAITRPHYPGDDRFVESPYTCEVRITDSALKDYFARFEGWWYPEI
jgi:hypothetical protein